MDLMCSMFILFHQQFRLLPLIANLVALAGFALFYKHFCSVSIVFLCGLTGDTVMAAVVVVSIELDLAKPKKSMGRD